jgi:hypothetical protein
MTPKEMKTEWRVGRRASALDDAVLARPERPYRMRRWGFVAVEFLRLEKIARLVFSPGERDAMMETRQPLPRAAP